MNETGELVDCNDDRGFGFVQTDEGERLFVHIKAFGSLQRRPEIGDRVAFRRGFGRDGRPAAISAKIAGLAARQTTVSGPSTEQIEGAQRARLLRIAAAALLLGAVLYVRNTSPLPGWIIWIYLVMGIVSAATYWVDKRAANAGRWRIAETTLHFTDFALGIIGGLLAQAALHHKTAKPSFAGATWTIVILHLAGLATIWFGLLDSLG